MKYLLILFLNTSFLLAQKGTIHIEVKRNQKIYLNNEEINLNDISKQVNYSTYKFAGEKHNRTIPQISAPSKISYSVIDKIKTELAMVNMRVVEYKLKEDETSVKGYGLDSFYKLKKIEKRYTTEDWVKIKKTSDSINNLFKNKNGVDPTYTLLETTYDWRRDFGNAVYSLQQDLINKVSEGKEIHCLVYDGSNQKQILEAFRNCDALILSFNHRISFKDYLVLLRQINQIRKELLRDDKKPLVIELTQEIRQLHKQEGINLCRS